MNHTGLWNAELTWYSPSAKSMNFLPWLGARPRNPSFWASPMLPDHRDSCNTSEIYWTIGLWYSDPSRLDLSHDKCFWLILCLVRTIKEISFWIRLCRTFVSSFFKHTRSKTMHNDHDIITHSMCLRTASITWYRRHKLARIKILQKFWLTQVFTPISRTPPQAILVRLKYPFMIILCIFHGWPLRFLAHSYNFVVKSNRDLSAQN